MRANSHIQSKVNYNQPRLFTATLLFNARERQKTSEAIASARDEGVGAGR